MRTVSIRQALTQFLENTDADKSILYDEISLLRWAKKADMAIGGTYAFQKGVKLYTASDNIVKLDNDVIKVHKVLLGDHTDVDIWNDNNNSQYYATVSITPDQENYLTEYQLWSDISMPMQSHEINYVIQNGKLILPIEYADKDVTVIYCSYPKNEEGDILVNDNHIDAIVAYLESKMMDKSIKSRKLKGNRIFNDDLTIQRDLRAVMGHELRHARVKDRDDNKRYEGENNDIVSVLIQFNEYEW